MDVQVQQLVNKTNSMQLQNLINDCISRNQYQSAIFFSHKLVTFSGRLEDVYNLSRCYFLAGQHKRALHLLVEKEGLASLNPPKNMSQNDSLRLQAISLAGKCAAACDNWEECLEILELADLETVTDTRDATIAASIYLLRGKALIALENRSRAATCFKDALKRDSTCYEAFEALVDFSMLTSSEANVFLSALHFPEGFDWLKEFYDCKLKRYNSSEEHVALLSATSPLSADVDVSVARSEMYFYRNEFQKCYEITKKILEDDPFNHGTVACIHLSTLVELKAKNELFYIAHKLVEESPHLAVSWYGVGCYYYLIGNQEAARKHFSKCTGIDSHFGYGWIGYGHSFGSQGEHDQAMAAYRTASRVMPGCHLPQLCIGMELIRVNNFALANQYITQAKEICPDDPLIENELGITCFKNKQYERAAGHFQRVLEMCTQNDNDINESWEPTVINLAHAFRKLRRYNDAIKYYELALSLHPANGSTYCAIGFTYQLQGKLELSIDFYHKALGLKTDDPFAMEMLNRSLELVQF